VCRQWQEASNDDPESLQLFMDLSSMSEEDQDRARGWMATHGQHVEVLGMEASNYEPQHLKAWFWQSAPALTNLNRLEVEQQHSLALLAPVLGRLPQLQHRAAHVTMRVKNRIAARGITEGVFLEGGGNQWCFPWGHPPDMQQLCPQLVCLHLTMHTDEAWLLVDERLPMLLPARLQQLTLVGSSPHRPACQVDCQDLLHLKALQQLTLDRVWVTGRGVLGQQLQALQQVRCYNPATHRLEEVVALQLAPKVTAWQCSTSGLSASMRAVPDMLAQLTSLQLDGGRDINPEAAVTLTALTGLQSLSLFGWCDSSAVPIVQRAAGMAQLRALRLQGHVVCPEEMSASLARCTQLTSLVLLFKVEAATAHPSHGMDPKSVTFMAVPEQLCGLRHLTVHQSVFQQQEVSWLAALTQLTSLHVVLPGCGLGQPPPGLDAVEVWKQLEAGYVALIALELLRVEGWPASLQQVVVWSSSSGGCKTHSQHFTPSGPSSRRVTVWYEQWRGTAQRWVRPLPPCPHLAGVWELQGEVAGGSSRQASFW
jgi:hypothetical protein